MMTFVNMDSDGLVILPTHRVVHSLAGFDPAAFAHAAEQFFTVETLPEADAAQPTSTRSPANRHRLRRRHSRRRFPAALQARSRRSRNGRPSRAASASST